MPQDNRVFRLSRQGLMLAMISTAFAAPALANTAAHVDFAVGAVTATGSDGRARTLAKGADVLSGDRVVTTNGRAQLRFTDGAFVSLQPNTTFEVREYRFDGKTDGTEKGFFGLLRGAMRTVTGLIGRVNRSAYQIQTPTATVGIRGTGGAVGAGGMRGTGGMMGAGGSTTTMPVFPDGGFVRPDGSTYTPPDGGFTRPEGGTTRGDGGFTRPEGGGFAGRD